jgi:hypothetical protein
MPSPDLHPPPIGTPLVKEWGPAPPWVRWLLQLWEYVRPMYGSDSWNPGNLVNGTGETSSAITVNGARLGDYVFVGAPYDLQGVTATGYVETDDAVRIRIHNGTGSDKNLNLGTWTVRVIKGYNPRPEAS